jgi:hypothetical protein
MNPETEIDRLLREDKSQLISDKNHYKWRLSNGKIFVKSKTASDAYRAGREALQDLRWLLGVGSRGKDHSVTDPTGSVNSQEKGSVTPPGYPKMDELGNDSDAKVTIPIASQPIAQALIPLGTGDHVLEFRVAAAIQEVEDRRTELYAEVESLDRKLTTLKALQACLSANQGVEEIIKSLLPLPQPQPVKAPVSIPAATQPITDRIYCTQALVYAATQTFDYDFTTNDVIERMTGSRQVDSLERQRVRSSICTILTKLEEQGKVLKIQQGIGKRYSIWRKPHPVPDDLEKHRAGYASM